MKNEFILRETKHSFAPCGGGLWLDVLGMGATERNVVMVEVKSTKSDGWVE